MAHKINRQFSQKWGIDLPELKPGKPEEVTNLVELKDLVQAYLDESPDTDVAEDDRLDARVVFALFLKTTATAYSLCN